MDRLRFFPGFDANTVVSIVIFTVAISVFPMYSLYIAHETNQRLIKFEDYTKERDARVEKNALDRDTRIKDYIRERDARWESYLVRKKE